MANIFSNLVPPAGNGVGAAVDVSAMGATKTITIQGTFTGVVTIEYSEDAGVSFAQLVTFAAGGKKTVTFAAQQMRVRRAGVGAVPGTPDIDVASDDIGQLFANLPVPAGNGTGAAVDVSLLGTLNTIVVTGSFTGNVIIEISEDSVLWTQCLFFQPVGGGQTKKFVAQFMRVRRSGVGVVPGTPVVNVGAANDATGPGGDNTLDNAYDQGGPGAGRTINADAGAVVIQSTAADNNSIIEITKNPVGAQAGSGIDVTMGAQTTGAGLNVTASGAGLAINVVSGDVVFGADLTVAGDYLASGAAPEIRVTTANDGWIIEGNRAVGDAGVDVVIRSANARAAGQVFAVRNVATDLLTVDFAGDATIRNSLLVGTTALVAGTTLVIDVAGSFGEITGDRDGVFSGIDADATIGAIAHVMSGFHTNPVVGSASTQNWTAPVGVRGYTADPGSSPGSAGTVTGMAGYYAADPSLGGAVVATSVYGHYVEAMTAGTTNNIGIWIETPAGGATLNDAIHVVGGRTFLGGDVEVPTGDVLVGTDSGFGLAPMVEVGRDFGDVTVDIYAIQVGATRSRTSGPFGGVVYAVLAGSAVGSANTSNWTTTGGGSSVAVLATPCTFLPGSAGTIAAVSGLEVGDVVDLSAGGVTLTTLQGIYIRALTTGATNNIGIWIEAPSGGATLNDAIHVVGGRTFIGGPIHIAQGVALGGGAAPALGTIGGAGPAVAAQNEWLAITTQNGAGFVPVWQ